MLLLAHRNTQRLLDMAASTLLRLLKPRLRSLHEHLGMNITQIFPHCDVDVGECLNEVVLARSGSAFSFRLNESFCGRL